MQMLLAHRVKRAVHPALNQREKALGGIRVYIAARVFARTMIDRLMAAGKLSLKPQ